MGTSLILTSPYLYQNHLLRKSWTGISSSMRNSGSSFVRELIPWGFSGVQVIVVGLVADPSGDMVPRDMRLI